MTNFANNSSSERTAKRKLAQSNSKSEDTPRMIDVHRKQLRAQRWLQDNTHEGMTPEPPQDTSLDDKATQHTHKWCHVSKAWEHCSVCDKWRSTSDAK